MKKVFMTALMGIAALTAGAQTNLQFHYDFGKQFFNSEEHNRADVTVTYEGFKADGTGSWYYFIDADFDKNGMSSAYTEISREFNVVKLSNSMTLAGHAEIDAGLSYNTQFASQYQPSFLVGPAVNWHNADFSKTASLQVMYKQYTGQNWNISGNEGGFSKPYSSFQVTGVWGWNFCNNKLRFAGFFDFWRGEKSDGTGQLVFITEPQLWYNVSNHCAFGTEWEMSENFIYNSYNGRDFFINPTLAFKYQF